MSSPVLYRSFSVADLEVRSTSEGRTICGLCVPYNTQTEIADYSGPYLESFRSGSFARSIQQRGAKVPLLAAHNGRTMPLGRASLLVERDAGLYGEFAVSKTVAGDEALELARDGAVSFSIGFTPVKDKWQGTERVERVEACLREVSLCALPAYPDAVVTGVRAADFPNFSTTAARRWVDIERLR